MRWVTTAAAAEIATIGLILLVSPLFARLIFGGEFSEAAQALGRFAGIALLSFALTTWPDPSARSVAWAMVTYNLLATVYLCYLGIVGKSVGVLLWPGVAMHLIFTVLLAVERATARQA